MPAEEVHTAESVAVQLTRIEGTVNRVFDRVDDLRTRTSALEVASVRHGSAIQRLDEQATAEQAKAVALAAALKEAEATRRQQSEQSWTPWQRFGAAVGGAATVIGALVAVIVAVKS
jgi:hypothetical protein